MPSLVFIAQSSSSALTVVVLYKSISIRPIQVKKRLTCGLDLTKTRTGDIALTVKSIVNARTLSSSIVFVRTHFVVYLTRELDGDVGST